MYNKNYYPTPKEVIQQMIAPHLGEIKSLNILEPSAGMGAILDYITSYAVGASKKRVYACENDQNLKATLTGKGYKVVQEDFLNYSGSLDFGLILMNPPFDGGVHHILKAWEILRNGHIVCLLNAETVKNLSTIHRQQLASLIHDHGSVEYIGNAFATADRKTNVDVALVRLQKKTERSKIGFDGMNGSSKVEEINLESSESGIEKRDYIDALCRSYQKAIQSTEAMYKAMTEFNLYVGAFGSEYDTPKLITAFFETSRKTGYSDAHNEFATAFQKIAWNKIFRNTKVSGLMTQKVREKFDKWRDDMGGIDLNEENIVMLFDALIQQRKAIADECIVDAFDKITANSESRKANEAWKTNSRYMVPEKFIMPWIVENCKWTGGLNVYHRKHDFLDDIDRAFCLVSGKAFENIRTTHDSIKDWCRNKDNMQESEFFEFKAHLKGTVHFKVKDLALLAEFNRRACAAKGFMLPDEEMYRGKSRRDQKVK